MNILDTKYLIIALLLLFVVHRTILPILRRRPIVLSKSTLRIVLLISSISALLFSNFIFLDIFIVILLILLSLPIWLVIGITDKDFSESINRTIQGTLMKAELIQIRSTIHFIQPAGNIYILRIFQVRIILSIISRTPKTKLFEEVWKKLIDNYSLHV